jgi:hypothetical protein
MDTAQWAMHVRVIHLRERHVITVHVLVRNEREMHLIVIHGSVCHVVERH